MQFKGQGHPHLPKSRLKKYEKVLKKRVKHVLLFRIKRPDDDGNPKSGITEFISRRTEAFLLLLLKARKANKKWRKKMSIFKIRGSGIFYFEPHPLEATSCWNYERYFGTLGECCVEVLLQETTLRMFVVKLNDNGHSYRFNTA